jgi:hypothetical protein
MNATCAESKLLFQNYHPMVDIRQEWYYNFPFSGIIFFYLE